MPSFQAPRPCSVLKLLQNQREDSSFENCLKKMYDKSVIEFGFSMIL